MKDIYNAPIRAAYLKALSALDIIKYRPICPVSASLELTMAQTRDARRMINNDSDLSDARKNFCHLMAVKLDVATTTLIEEYDIKNKFQ